MKVVGCARSDSIAINFQKDHRAARKSVVFSVESSVLLLEQLISALMLNGEEMSLRGQFDCLGFCSWPRCLLAWP
jgi:hypothetical protein